MTPKKKARKGIKAKIREIIKRGGAAPAKVIISKINQVLAGWVSRLRENFTSGSDGEGLETYLNKVMRQSFIRQACFRELKREIGSAETQTRNSVIFKHVVFQKVIDVVNKILNLRSLTFSVIQG